jgi:endonuclease/exonuclease/phosphatase family metal-dependent hydrolase
LTSSLSSAEPSLELKLLTFNVLYSGDHTPLVRTAHVIDSSDADIIGLQESHTSTTTLAHVLAMHHASFAEGRALLSKHPIVEKLKHGVRIELPGRQECYVFVIHFTPYPYQPYDLRDGKLKSSVEAVEAARKTRQKEVNETLAEVQHLIRAGKAVFVMGDFNEPSHLDWTESAKSRHFNFIVPWPTSMAMTSAGLTDAYRAIHPNPLTHPGDTWTPWHEMPADEKHDRIDLIYFAGRQIKPVAASVIGESKDRADIVIPNYPSDHRAVLSKFEIPP